MAKQRGKAAPRKTVAHRPDRTALVALLTAAAVLVVAGLYITPFIPDDSYISFRYSENLVDGHGLSFNAGERLEAYSNLLWILIGAAFYALGMSLPAVMPIAGLVLALASLVILWRMCRERAEHDAQLYFPLLVFALANPFVIYAVSGMETALFSFLLLLLVYFADKLLRENAVGHWAGLAVSGLLLALTRPEGVVVLPFALVWILWDTRGSETPAPPWRMAIATLSVYLVAYAAYTTWRVSYFGHWLPTPYMSKGHDAFGITAALTTNLRQYFVRGGFVEAPAGYYFATLALLGLAGVVRARSNEYIRADRLALAIALVMSVVYVNFVDWMPGMRYHAPLIVLFCLPLVALQRCIPRARWEGFARSEIATALVVLILMGAYGIHRAQAVTAEMSLGRVECTIPLGKWLADSMPSNSLVAIGDVGAVPYYSGLRTLDIHPESLTDRHIAETGLSVDYMFARKPDAVMLNVRGVYSAKMDALHYKYYMHPNFAAEYNFIGTVRHRWFTDRAYWVFVHESISLRDEYLRAFPAGLGTQRRVGFTLPEGRP